MISIAEDDEGGLWFGTCGGVSFLSGGTWTSYTVENGLLSDTVYDIAFDLDGSVWFATGAGACRLRNGIFDDFLTGVPDRMASSLPLEIYYNPAAQSFHLSYHLNQSAPVSARLFNLSGMLITQWSDLPSSAGENRAAISIPGRQGGEPLVGLFMIQLIQGNRTNTQKIIMIH